MIGFIDTLHTARNYRQLQRYFWSAHLTVHRYTHYSSQSSLVVSWQRIYHSLTVTSTHIKSSFHRLILFLPLFCDCQFRKLDSIQFRGSYPGRLASRNSTLHSVLLSLSLSLILRPTISRPVCLGIKHPSGAYDQIFITVRQLGDCWCGARSLTGGWVSRLQLLLTLASAVIFGSESSGTRDHILLSQIRDFPFRRLLRLAGLRWRYSTPPPHGSWILLYNHFARTPRKHLLSHIVLGMFTAPFHSNGRGADRIENSLSIVEACLPSRFLAMGIHVTIFWI
jgi:hypothetical protein